MKGTSLTQEEGERSREVKREGDGEVNVKMLIAIVGTIGIVVIGLFIAMASSLMYLRKRVRKLENVEMHAGLIERYRQYCSLTIEDTNA